MDMLELIKKRRSIRKYQREQIGLPDLEKIIEAGLYAPNAGGRQSPFIVAIHDADLAARVGRLNRATFSRENLAGVSVSSEQPSIIDDPGIQNAFYDAPTVCAIFAADGFRHGVPDAYCCADNMVLMATSLGLGSCIVARGEETFATAAGRELTREWGVPDGYSGCCFVLLGYCRGEYPHEKARKPGRYKIIE